MEISFKEIIIIFKTIQEMFFMVHFGIHKNNLIS